MVITLPSLLLGVLFAGLYGALFHLVRGGSLRRLFSYLLLSMAGFALGHIIGNWRSWILFPIGPLNFGAATLGSILLLASSLIPFRRILNRNDAV